MGPDIVGRHVVEARLVARALAGGDDLEARRPRPIDHLRDQCRLVAVGERIDHAGLRRLPGEQRPGEAVGLDVDHHHVAPGGEAGAGVGDARGRVPGRVDDDIETVRPDKRKGIVADVGAAALHGLGEGEHASLVLLPSGAGERGIGAGGVEVRHGHHVKAGGPPGLGQEHGAELAGPDQSDAHGLSGARAFLKHPMKVHGALL